MIHPLQVINTESGLARIGGNKKLYNELLQRFLLSNEATIDILQRAFAQGDYQIINMTLHTLKGVAGTIGADHLYAVTRDFQISSKEGQSEKLAMQMDVFSNSLLNVLDFIRSLEYDVAQVNTPQGADLSYSKALIDSLESYLTNYDTEAIAVFDKLKMLPVAADYQGNFKAIQMSMNKYDFDKALEQLKELTQSIS